MTLSRTNCGNPFEVVFVCTGNRARSPLAEALFRHHAAGIEPVVSSVGTLDLGPVPALPLGIEAAERLGVDLTRHRARTLRDLTLASADLVVGFEPMHVSAAVVEGGAHASRTFLLGELVTLLDVSTADSDPCERARFVVADADSRRVRYNARPDVLIPDPLGKSAKVMRRTADQIDRLVRQLVIGLFGVEVPSAEPASGLRRAIGRGR